MSAGNFAQHSSSTLPTEVYGAGQPGYHDVMQEHVGTKSAEREFAAVPLLAESMARLRCKPSR